VRPDIGGLLPVFVLDRYEGVEARLLQDFTPAERERYVELNAAAVREHLPADLVFANHVLLGAPVGAFILGVYLFISIRIFGRHNNEAFSSLRIQDFKQWLRLRIDASGGLTIHAIAIDRVPRRWRSARRAGESTIEADDARASAPRLIDKVELRP